MTITTFLTYLLIGFYFVIERLLRRGKKALSLQAGSSDRGSSQIIWINGLLSIFLISSAPTLNANRVGYLNNVYLAWMGILLMLAGLFLRYWAAKVLGEFYTRTLQIVEKQQIIDRPPYNIIRHPGYLGLFLMNMGASLALNNWLVLIVAIALGVPAYVYRIQAEEKMLSGSFEEEYQVYMEKTWRLIPFIY